MNLPSIVMTIAALQGAAGVSLAAAAAHVDANPLLATASQFLMIHAAAGVGLAARLAGAPPLRRVLAGATFAMQAGVTLFSADLAARVYLGGKLFPYAAPMGGGLTILAWLALAIWGAATIARRE
ncbi:MAG: DUF423 domain-containing protein [Methylocystis sp.]|uniref:DUF423 domain-containing protein n=1 Tax=Methylocystis sp. TaxID=1911079 RepID=UPI003DA3E5C6